MLFRILLQLSALIVVGCAANPNPANAPRVSLLGHIMAVEPIKTGLGGDRASSVATGTFQGGAIGAVVASLTHDLMELDRTHQLYTIRLAGGREVRVPAKPRFALGECVSISVPETAAEDAYFLPGEALVSKDDNCRLSESSAQ